VVDSVRLTIESWEWKSSRNLRENNFQHWSFNASIILFSCNADCVGLTLENGMERIDTVDFGIYFAFESVQRLKGLHIIERIPKKLETR